MTVRRIFIAFAGLLVALFVTTQTGFASAHSALSAPANSGLSKFCPDSLEGEGQTLVTVMRAQAWSRALTPHPPAAPQRDELRRSAGASLLAGQSIRTQLPRRTCPLRRARSSQDPASV